jgi:hypothetical protein
LQGHDALRQHVCCFSQIFHGDFETGEAVLQLYGFRDFSCRGTRAIRELATRRRQRGPIVRTSTRFVTTNKRRG